MRCDFVTSSLRRFVASLLIAGAALVSVSSATAGYRIAGDSCGMYTTTQCRATTQETYADWLARWPLTIGSGPACDNLHYSAFGENTPNGILNATNDVSLAFTIDAATNTRLQAGPSPITFNLRFPGQYFDQESNLNQNYFRSYDARISGGYTQPDPIGLSGGLNRFGYVGGNPLSFDDPDGLQRRVGGPVAPLFPRIGPTLPAANPQVGTTRAPVEVRPGTNPPGEIGGRPFSGHAFDRMQGRGIPPSAVMNTILSGRQSPGNMPNTTQYYDPVNNITVVVNSTTGNVITLRNGPPSNSCP